MLKSESGCLVIRKTIVNTKNNCVPVRITNLSPGKKLHCMTEIALSETCVSIIRGNSSPAKDVTEQNSEKLSKSQQKNIH